MNGSELRFALVLACADEAPDSMTAAPIAKIAFGIALAAMIGSLIS